MCTCASPRTRHAARLNKSFNLTFSPSHLSSTKRLHSTVCPCLLPPPPVGIPLELIKPEILGSKVFEPLLLLGKQRWGFLDIRLRVRGGGHVSQVYGE